VCFRVQRNGWLLTAAGGLGLASVLGFEDILWPVLGNGTMLVLTASVAMLVVAAHARSLRGVARPLPGTGWLRWFGRLSYEVYLTHMFVVWPLVHAFVATGASPRWGFLWYAPTVALSGLLGWLVARGLSVPAERWMKGLLR
jgi:peptidoglycan/LPS O-acetylase OafA/YrhL